MFMLGLSMFTVSFLLAVLFVLVCVFMSLAILVQRARGGGLVGAFGGQGSVQQAFGSKTGDLFTWFTVGCFVAFLLLAMGLTWTTRAETRIEPAPAPTAPAAAAPESTAPITPAAAPPGAAPVTTPPAASTPVPATQPTSP